MGPAAACMHVALLLVLNCLLVHIQPGWCKREAGLHSSPHGRERYFYKIKHFIYNGFFKTVHFPAEGRDVIGAFYQF